MSEIAEMWAARREADQRQRHERLAAADPTGWKQHTPYHWSRVCAGKRLDYWPTKHKFMYDKRVMVGDVRAFIEKREREEL